jgi:hypothetical protein
VKSENKQNLAKNQKSKIKNQKSNKNAAVSTFLSLNITIEIPGR